MKKHYIFLLALISISLFPHAVSAATISLSPALGSFTVGTTFTVTARVNAQGGSINSAEANINYSTDTLELVSVKQGSTFYLATPGSPSRSGGAYFGGGVPSPGYVGGAGSLGIMTFRAKAAGDASVSIANASALLNDGQGTNALSESSGAQYTITQAKVETPSPQPAIVGSDEVLKITSGTHPNSDAWYSKTTTELVWSRPVGAYGFSFSLDKNPATIPDDVLDTTVTTQKSFQNLTDGIWYFHIKSRSRIVSTFADTRHFALRVDTTAPEKFTPTLHNGDTIISFATSDAGSGIEFYSVLVDGVAVLERATSPFKLNELTPGPHTVTIVALDYAGNKTVSEPVKLSVAPKDDFEIRLKINWWLVLLLASVILNLIWLVSIAVRRIRSRKKAKTVETTSAGYVLRAEIDTTLNNLKTEIQEKLTQFTEQEKQRLTSRETDVVADLSSVISKTQQVLDKKLRDVNKKIKPDKS